MSSESRQYMSKKQRACDACRIRKRACRIDGPASCDFCFRSGKPCIFTDSTNRRKQKPAGVQAQDGTANGQVRPDAGRILGESQDVVMQALSDPSLPPEASTVMGSEGSTFDHRLRDFAMLDFGSHPLFGIDYAHFGDGYMLDDFNENPFGSGNDSHVDSRNVLSSIDNAEGQTSHISLDADTTATSQFIGHTSDMDPHLLQLYRYDQDHKLRFKRLTIQALDRGRVPIQFLLSDQTKSGPPTGRLSKELEDIISQDNGDRMIKLYEKYISRQYPIFGDTPTAKSAPSYLLAALYLTVQPYITYDEQLCVELAYEGLPRQQLLDLFYRSLGPVIARPSIATVQALFLMVIYPGDPLIFEGPSRWTMFGTLVSCAQTVGLHLDPSPWNLAPPQLALRRMLSGLIYSTDKWLAASFGKPPLLRLDNWLVTDLGQGDAADATNARFTCSPSLRLHIQCSSVLDRTLTDLYSLRAISELGADPWTTMDKARPLLEELKAWHRTFASAAQDLAVVSPTSTVSSSAPVESADHHVYELGYHFIRILVLRAVFRPFVQQTASPTSHENRDSHSYHEARSNARLGIRACTTDALHYIRSLRQEDATYTFWPPWASGVISSLCYLLLLMVATAEDYNDAAEWLQELQAVRTELRVKSAGLPVLRLGLLRIDSIFWKDVGNVLVLPAHVMAALQDAGNDAS